MAHTISRRLALLLDIQIPKESLPTLPIISRRETIHFDRGGFTAIRDAVASPAKRTVQGWKMPWYTITDSFDADFGVDEWHGHNVFFRDGERVFRTYFINARGDEAMGTTWSYLDATPLGRQETWEDSPESYPQPMQLDLGLVRAAPKSARIAK
jgi:hypothetical protein